MSAGNYCHFNDGKNDETFSIQLFGKDIRLKQNPSSRAVGHGAVVWDASVIFAKYMENNPSEFDWAKLHGKTVLELGSGCGLAGLSFLIRGASVTFTDMESVTRSLTERNVQVGGQYCLSLSWSLLNPLECIYSNKIG